MTDTPPAAPDARDSARTSVRAFVNERPVDVPRGGTALDAVRALDPALADAVVAGARAIADSRGLPVAPTSAVHGGAIYRLIAARPGGAAPDPA